MLKRNLPFVDNLECARQLITVGGHLTAILVDVLDATSCNIGHARTH